MNPALAIGSILVCAAAAVILLAGLPTFTLDYVASPLPTPSVLVTATPGVVFPAHAEEITCLAVSPDGQFLATASYVGPTFLDELLHGQSQRKSPAAGSPRCRPTTKAYRTAGQEQGFLAWDHESWLGVQG